MASLAGAWMALVAGFGGMRDHGGDLSFAPRLPDGITRLAFTITYRGGRLNVDSDTSMTTYDWRGSGLTLEIGHHGQPIVLKPNSVEQARVPASRQRPAPAQPAGRAPLRRRSLRSSQVTGPGARPSPTSPGREPRR
jgi:alpha,alpha-trehalose phosphorylase